MHRTSSVYTSELSLYTISYKNASSVSANFFHRKFILQRCAIGFTAEVKATIKLKPTHKLYNSFTI